MKRHKHTRNEMFRVPGSYCIVVDCPKKPMATFIGATGNKFEITKETADMLRRRKKPVGSMF